MNIKIDDELKKDLFKKYRTEIFETEDIDINEISELISDDELIIMFGLNLGEMIELINQKPMDKEKVRKLLVSNVNLHKIAKKREITLHGTSFLMKIASKVDYNLDKLYNELNVGVYNNKFARR